MVPAICILLTLALPAFALWKHGKQTPLRRPYLFSIGSFTFCAIGIIEEIYAIKRRLIAGDIGGIEDTIDAALMLSIGLLVFAVILNLLAPGLSCEGAEGGEHS